jgi:hypothetical protein
MASEKQHSYIATGPRESDTDPDFTGFSTGLTPPPRFFDYGVNALGKTCGVFASSQLGADRNVRAVPRGVGVYALGGAVGIYGEAMTNRGTGIKGAGGNGGPGGEFSSFRGPQVRLPSERGHMGFPAGRAGDLFVQSDNLGNARLWFCTNDAAPGNPRGCWRRVAFDATVGQCPE